MSAASIRGGEVMMFCPFLSQSEWIYGILEFDDKHEMGCQEEKCRCWSVAQGDCGLKRPDKKEEK